MSNIIQFSNCQVKINDYWCEVSDLVIFEHQIHFGTIFLSTPHSNFNFSQDVKFYLPGILDIFGRLRIVNYTKCLYQLNSAIFTKLQKT